MTASFTNSSIQTEFSRCENEQSGVDGQTDARIEDNVYRTLWDIDVLRRGDLGQIGIAVRDGVVFLSGHAISGGNRQRAEDAARTVPGVLDVRNDLFADDRLLAEVASALGEIEHHYRVKFSTGVNNGVVQLTGEVDSLTVRLLAEQCAASISGVRGVMNSVIVLGNASNKEDPRFLQPQIGVKIYFRNGLYGQVDKVIINPDNRRVIAMVLRGRFSSSLQDPRFMSYDTVPAPERLISIPIDLIRHLTKDSGFLTIDTDEAASYRTFDLADFSTPGPDWIPPYPYCPADVLFPAHHP